MPEQFDLKNLDYSEPKNQEAFLNAEKEKQDETKEYARAEAERIEKHVKNGWAENYKKAIKDLDYKRWNADYYLKERQADKILDNLEKYQGLDLDYEEIALKMIKNGDINHLIHTKGFQDLDHKKLIFMMIDAGKADSLKYALGYFRKIDKETLIKLMEIGFGSSVAEYCGEFNIILNKEFADKFIDIGKGESVAKNLDKFQGLDHKEIVKTLIEKGKGESVAKNLDKFQGLDHKEIAIKLIEAGEGVHVAYYLEKFQGLDHKEIAQRLIEKGKGSSVSYFLEKFQGLDHKEIARRLINANNERNLIEDIEKFQGIDYREIIRMSIEKAERYPYNNDRHRSIEIGRLNSAIRSKLQTIDERIHNDIALDMLELNRSDLVVESLHEFKNLNKEVALKLIQARKVYSVVGNLEKFQGLDHKEIALKLIEIGEGKSLARNLEKFQGLNKEIALKLIEIGEGKSVAENLKNFQFWTEYTEVISKFIEAGQGDFVISNFEKFQGLDREIALKLIEIGEGKSVAENLNKFQWIDYKKIISKRIEAVEEVNASENLVEAGEEWDTLENWGEIQGLDKEIALKLIEVGRGDSVASNLEKFQGLDKEIALKLIEVEKKDSVAENLKKFQGLDKEIAIKLIEAGEGVHVAYYLEKFQDLNYKEIALKLIEACDGYYVAENISRFQGLDREEIQGISEKYNLIFDEAIYFYIKNEENDEENNKDEYKNIYHILKRGHPNWNDPENIAEPFEAGAEYFGYEKMFKYIGQENRHDVLYNFRNIVTLAQASGLKPEQFYGKILNQIIADGAQYSDDEYGSITSREYFNEITSAVDVEKIEELLAKAREYNGIAKLQELVQDFSQKENIFRDWKSLKKYYELIQLLGKTEILDQLKDLKVEGKEKLYKYIETLAFHPGIDMQKIIQFWQDPEDFLDITEIHAREAHELKKPSNYINIPNLDLSAGDLRDALVEGDLDKLEDWEALNIEYEFPKVIGELPKSLRYHLAKNLGVRDVEIRKAVSISEDENLTRNGELFSRLSKRFKAEGLDLIAYLKGKIEIPKSLEEELEQFRGQEKEQTVKYRVKINLKSDPDGVVAGNDTACCMPFGSGKNNVYTYNPVCALFTIQQQVGEGWRTVAQSVLTKDIDIKKPVPEILEKIANQNTKMDDLVSEEVLIEAEHIITCDNIEVAPNFKGRQGGDTVLQYIYRDFFQEYVKRYGQEENLDKNQVIVGVGYSDLSIDAENVRNTFVPIAPVGYSDNIGEKSLSLSLTKKQAELAIKKTINDVNRPKRTDLRDSKTKGIKDLTFKDSLQVAYLEGKAYKDNESLIQYLHNMENALVAKDINNVSKNRANLSLKYVDDKNKMQGYILGYEGKRDDERIIYVADLAANPSSKMAGGRLILGFLERYKTEYIDKGDLVPILAQAREQTSYKIITKQLEKMGEDIGVKFELEELGESSAGEDTMHEIIIRPIKK